MRAGATRGTTSGVRGACVFAALLCLWTACGDDGETPPVDGGASDLGADLGSDAGPPDLGVDLPGCPDGDGDGVPSATCGGGDCDDADPSRYPGATEVCDGDDEDCDDTTLGPDADGDGAPYFGCCNASGRCGADCDDARATVNVAAFESCNGVDDDCDGTVDEGVLAVACFDVDGDGRGPLAVTEVGCTLPIGATTICNDCNDRDATRFLGASERCNGADDDCDGVVDEDCECTTGSTRPCGTEVGACRAGTQRCIGTPSVWEALCSDAVAPSVETCDGEDDDCDGAVDEGLTTTFYADCDADGSGASGPGTVACTRPTTLPAGCTRVLWVTESGDCDDTDPTRNARSGCGVTMDAGVDAGAIDLGVPDLGCTPTGAEVCNGLDDDCDGVVDDLPPALGSLTLSCGAIVPAFAPETSTYRVALAPGAATCEVTATPACASHALSIDDAPVATGASRSIDITRFVQAVTITVASPDGTTVSRVVALTRTSRYVKASNTEAFDDFGGAVALSADGATLAVGASGEDSAATGVGNDAASNAASGSGAVYLFRRTAGGIWAQEAYVKASNTEASDVFGAAITLSGDGTVLAISAVNEGSNARGVDGAQTGNLAELSGAVYLFRRSPTGVWAQEAYVKASNTGAFDAFGSALALSADGATLAVGAEGEDSAATGVGGAQSSNATSGSGAVYVFARSTAGEWAQEAYVKASNTDSFDGFGRHLALSADGSTLAVGSPFEDSAATVVGGDQGDNTAEGAGAVYVFRRGAMGAWAQDAYVKASNAGAGDSFGSDVALSGDGATLAVGANLEGSSATGVDGDPTDNGAEAAGAAYVFRRSGTGAWTQEAYVKASNTGMFDQFGESLALSDDGSTLAVGAPGEASDALGIGGDSMRDTADSAGAAYVFRRSVTGTWTQEAYVKASNTEAEDRFGSVLALSGDGRTLAVGATFERSAATGVDGDQTNNAATRAGAVYVY
jgi:hypothetical protein